MVLNLPTPNDSRLSALQCQFTLLGNELDDIQSRYANIKEDHGKKCAQSLKESLISLLTVIDYVKKSDKTLVFWVEKGHLRRSLRIVGIDKRTQTIVKKQTKKVKLQVQTVERQFSRSSEAFMDGLRAVQDLQTDVTSYSITSLGEARSRATSFGNELDESVNQMQRKLEKSHLEVRSAQEEVDVIPSRIRGVESERKMAQQASNSSGNTSAASFGIAALLCVGSFFVPPLAPFALAAGGVGAASGMISVGYDSQVNNLRNRECELQNKLNDLRAQIKTLEASIPSLDQERLSFEQTRQSVSTLEIRCSQLREDSHTILDELLQAQVVLSSIQMKTEQIAIELSECGYCNTRREIAGRLRDIVEGIQNAGKSRTIGYERNEVADALRKLNKIERRTNTVLMIMER